MSKENEKCNRLTSRKTYEIQGCFSDMEEKVYRISIEEHCQKTIKLPQTFTCSVSGYSITCDDSERVKIQADTSQHEQLQLSFQLAYRYVDDWDHYLRLTDNISEGSTEVKPIKHIDTKELENWCKTFAGLDKTILLFLHRASDFIGVYSEVAIIIALFAFELQVNKTYDRKKPRLPATDSLHRKICNLHKSGAIRNGKKLLWLLALKELRNKLAHGYWGDVINGKIRLCDKKCGDLIICILGLTNSDFVPSPEGTLRLDHPPSKSIIKQIIDAILMMDKIK